MNWILDHWFDVYVIGGLIVWAIGAVVSFFGIWWFAADNYDLAGVLLGWVPGAVAAVTAAALVGALWPLAFVVLLLLFNRP